MVTITPEQVYNKVKKFINKREKEWIKYNNKLANKLKENPKRKQHWKEEEKLRELSILNLYDFININNYRHQLKKLPPIPDFITDLIAHTLGLEELKLGHLKNLKSITVSYNKIKYFEFPPNLTHLDISHNILDSRQSIGDFPESLHSLNLNDCQILKLDNLPKNLKTLNCQRNQLTSVPLNRQHQLVYLNISNNNLNTLSLPTSLKHLIINDNPIIKIINNGATIDFLDCSKVQFKSFLIEIDYYTDCMTNAKYSIKDCFNSLQRITIIDNLDPLYWRSYNFQTLVMKEFLNNNTNDIFSLPQHATQKFIKLAIANNESCPITHELLNENETAILSCFHLFNKEAIESWLKVSKTCPYCSIKAHIIN